MYRIAGMFLICAAALIAAPLAAQNTPPTISVFSGATPVADESVVTVAPGDMLAGLDLTITVEDADNDACELSLTVSNFTTQGLVPSEWEQASAVPFSRTPSSGTFNVADVEHTVVLLADDGTDTTTLTLFVLVAAATGNSTPKVVLQAGDAYIEAFAAVPIPYNTQVSALGLEAKALDADATDTLDISIAVSNFTTQGLVIGEWTATGAPPSAELTPTSGQFNVGDVVHVVSVTISDGTATATYNYILLIGPDGASSTNAAPFIGLFAGDAYIGDGTTVPVPFNTTVAALGLSLIVADFEGDATSTALLSVSNFTSQGLVPAEWESAAAAVPYTLNPGSGQFNVGSVNHLVSLEAGDGSNTSGYSFTVQVGADGTPPPVNSDDGDDDDDNGCTTGPGTSVWMLLAALAVMLTVSRTRRQRS